MIELRKERDREKEREKDREREGKDREGKREREREREREGERYNEIETACIILSMYKLRFCNLAHLHIFSQKGWCLRAATLRVA